MAHTVADVAGPPAEQAPEKDMAMTAQQWRLGVVKELPGTTHLPGVDVTQEVRE